MIASATSPATAPQVTLVLGGARSGKSAVAERIAAAGPSPVTYVATMRVGEDRDLADRVAAHRARRPTQWTTVEAGTDLVPILRRLAGTAVVDSLGPWVAAHDDGLPDAQALCTSLRSRAGSTVVVSEEVGFGVHPSSSAGRHFRDSLGVVNQEVAAVSDEVLLVVAGRILVLGRHGQI